MSCFVHFMSATNVSLPDLFRCCVCSNEKRKNVMGKRKSVKEKVLRLQKKIKKREKGAEYQDTARYSAHSSSNTFVKHTPTACCNLLGVFQGQLHARGKSVYTRMTSHKNITSHPGNINVTKYLQRGTTEGKLFFRFSVSNASYVNIAQTGDLSSNYSQLGKFFLWEWISQCFAASEICENLRLTCTHLHSTGIHKSDQ